MTRWSAITRTRGRRSALAYGSRSTTARKTTSTGSYTTGGDATRPSARHATRPTSTIPYQEGISLLSCVASGAESRRPARLAVGLVSVPISRKRGTSRRRLSTARDAPSANSASRPPGGGSPTPLTHERRSRSLASHSDTHTLSNSTQRARLCKSPFGDKPSGRKGRS